MKRRLRLFFILMAGAFPGVSWAATYYVSPTGTALWAQCTSSATPCSVASAMSNAAAGDVVYFRGGDYYPPYPPSDPSISWKPSNGGTVGNPIIFSAYPSETPTIYQPTGSGAAAAMGVSRKSNFQSNSYIVFDGFTYIKTKHMSAGGVWKCELADHVIVRNSTFVGNNPWQTSAVLGVSNSPDRTGYSRVTIADPINSSAAASSNKIFVTLSGTGDYNGSFTDFTTNAHVYYVDEYNFDIERAFVSSQTGMAMISDAQNQVGLYNTDCTDLDIHNNIFRDFGYDAVTGYGATNSGAMWLLGGLRAVVRNNNFVNMANAIQTKGSADGISSYNNFFKNVMRPFHWVQQWAGIKDFLIYNNVAILPPSGAFVNGIGAVPWGNNLVYNNTIYCTGNCTGIEQTNSNMLELVAFNNIIAGASGTTTFLRYDNGTGTPTYSDYNDFSTAGVSNFRIGSSADSSLTDWQSRTVFDDHSVSTSPNFTNASGLFAVVSDFKRSSPPSDGRPGYALIMGAYITGDEVIGYLSPAGPDATPPTAPRGLEIR